MNYVDFYVRRLHSVTGILPIGFFMLEHLFSISQAIFGAKAFDSTVAKLQGIPGLVFIEIMCIGIPIAFHAVYGLYVTYAAKNNPLSYSYFRNWMFYLQRLTAIITLLFVGWHVWVLRIGKALYGTQITFSYMSQLLSDPIIFTIYVISVVAAIFHFANGLWTFLITWGITVGTRAQRAAMYGCCAVFLLLSSVGLMATAAFIK